MSQNNLQKFAIDDAMLKRFAENTQKDTAAARAVAKNGLQKASVNQDVLRRHNFVFNTESKMGKITNQKQSGRCWIFAAMNAARAEVLTKLELEDFNFSKVYPLFWDKLEKSNYFLESILETLDEPRDGRLLAHLLKDPIQDGGQWDMYAGILEKYGAVPESEMPETFHSSSTSGMVSLITRRLRAWACQLRKAYAEGSSEAELRERKEGMLAEVYQILVNCLGEPPKSFSFSYYDKNKKYHRMPELTPREFFHELVSWKLEDKLSLINAPTADKPFGKVYTVKYLGTVKEAKPIHYLNLPIEVLKSAAIAALKDGEPVWFGCDVGQMLLREEGIMDLEAYDYAAVAGPEPAFSKAERLDYGESVLTHAMVFTGVELDEQGQPLRWKVENSWSDKSGHEGLFSMSDAWFDEYNYEIMVDKKYLPEEWHKALDEEIIELEPWDPMGALAGLES
ncbi:MAG: C1 family peptidase [Eubacteriales bacterium]|nr:C1 family peptidase [Eubacteriales bacterium]